MQHRIQDYSDLDLLEALKCKNFTEDEHLEMIAEIELRAETAEPIDTFDKRWNGKHFICK